MVAAERVEAIHPNGHKPDAKVLTPSTPTWRDNPLLFKVFNEFEKNGIFRVPQDYLADVFSLVETWDEKDKETIILGRDMGREEILEHRLYEVYEDGRKELIATITPRVKRYDEIVRTDSPEHAGEFLKRLDERHTARMQELERKASEAAVIYRRPLRLSNGYHKVNGASSTSTVLT